MVKKLNLNDVISNLEEINNLGLQKAQEMSSSEHARIRSTRDLEDQKFNEFKEIIKNERYFKHSHIKALNIPHHILIHVSCKNTGKTTHIYEMMRQCIRKGEKFIYGRVHSFELEGEIVKFDEDSDSPVIIIEDKGRYYFFRKDHVDEYIRYQRSKAKPFYRTYLQLTKHGYDYVGLGMTFYGSNTIGGGKYEDFSTIFFDEIVSYYPKQYVNDKVLYNGGCAVSTILRNKKDLHIVMMGNLQPGYIPILDYYDIDISDDLRIIRRFMSDNDPAPCTILYINSGSLYKAALENQASVAHHARLEDRLFQLGNKPIVTSNKVLRRRIFEDLKYILAFAVVGRDTYLVFHIRHTDEEPDKFCLSVTQLTLTTYVDGPIMVSYNSRIHTQFSFVSAVMDIQGGIEWVNSRMESNVLYFDSVKSLTLAIESMHELVKAKRLWQN